MHHYVVMVSGFSEHYLLTCIADRAGVIWIWYIPWRGMPLMLHIQIIYGGSRTFILEHYYRVYRVRGVSYVLILCYIHNR